MPALPIMKFPCQNPLQFLSFLMAELCIAVVRAACLVTHTSIRILWVAWVPPGIHLGS